jgi:hypothetical protein
LLNGVTKAATRFPRFQARVRQYESNRAEQVSCVRELYGLANGFGRKTLLCLFTLVFEHELQRIEEIGLGFLERVTF